MKRFTSQYQKIGKIGEDLAERFLVKHGFTIKEKNFTIPTGEIDIITEKDKKFDFWEVKTIQCVLDQDVSRRTYNAFENIHEKKLSRMMHTVEYYLQQNNVSHETEYGIHGIAVYLDLVHKKAKIEKMMNII